MKRLLCIIRFLKIDEEEKDNCDNANRLIGKVA